MWVKKMTVGVAKSKFGVIVHYNTKSHRQQDSVSKVSGRLEMNMQLFEKIDGLIGISILALMFVALAASQAGAESGLAGHISSDGGSIATATAPAAEPGSGLVSAATEVVEAEIAIRIDASQAESIVDAVGSLIITAAVRDSD